MTVSIENDGPVTIIILSRPGVRNAVDRDTAQELADAFRAFEMDEGAKVAVFSGDQGQFCAGADLKKIAAGKPNRMDPAGDGPMGPTRMRMSKPVIAAISGYAVAGGLELALWCDLRVMEEDAVLGVFCRRWGVPLIDGGTVRLPRLIGLSRALDLILTGRPVEAREALQMGLVNRVVPKGKARDQGAGTGQAHGPARAGDGRHLHRRARHRHRQAQAHAQRAWRRRNRHDAGAKGGAGPAQHHEPGQDRRLLAVCRT